jgi:hypothetical protein
MNPDSAVVTMEWAEQILGPELAVAARALGSAGDPHPTPEVLERLRPILTQARREHAA